MLASTLLSFLQRESKSSAEQPTASESLQTQSWPQANLQSVVESAALCSCRGSGSTTARFRAQISIWVQIELPLWVSPSPFNNVSCMPPVGLALPAYSYKLEA